MQVTQRDGTFYLSFKYDASERMSLSIYWGLDTVALSSSVEQWNLKHAAAAAPKPAPSAIMTCLPMFARSYNQMRDEHVIEMSHARTSLGGAAAAAAAAGAFHCCTPFHLHHSLFHTPHHPP